MCGRFTRAYKWAELHRLMALTRINPLPLDPSWNVAPTQQSPVVREEAEGNRGAAMLTWGLVPSWSDDPGRGIINARSEEAAGKPSFRSAVKLRRCLIPVSGFYEWQAIEGSKVKQPWYFSPKGSPLFAFAGLWERWNKTGETLETFTILTGSPNELVAPIHNRMPCIVAPESYSLWLDPKRLSIEEVADALAQFPAAMMEARRVSTRVNSPRNNDASLLEAA